MSLVATIFIINLACGVACDCCHCWLNLPNYNVASKIQASLTVTVNGDKNLHDNLTLDLIDFIEELLLLFSMHINIIQKHLVSHTFVLSKLKPLIFAIDV